MEIKAGDLVQVYFEADSSFHGFKNHYGIPSNVIAQSNGKKFIVSDENAVGGYYLCGYPQNQWIWPSYAIKPVLTTTPERPMRQELHIIRDGETTHAIYKEDDKVVRREKAICHPDDEYDFEIGTKIAVDRIFGQEASILEEAVEFDIEEFFEGEQAVNCQTENDAIIFLAYLHGIGIDWFGGASLIRDTLWGSFGDQTCYYFDNKDDSLRYNSIDYYKSQQIPAIVFDRLKI